MVKKPATAKPAGTVPESVLKKRKRDEDWAAKKAATAGDAKKKSRDQRKEIFKRAESYVKEYRDQVHSVQTRAFAEVYAVLRVFSICKHLVLLLLQGKPPLFFVVTIKGRFVPSSVLLSSFLC